MPGQPTPPRIVEAFALNAPASTQAAPVAGGKNVIPTATSSVTGAASLNDGFPPLTMTLPDSNGLPPQGQDMNGILYLLSAWVAALAAGQLPVFDPTLATDMGGYALGAVLQQDANPNAFWINQVNGNSVDPDVTPTNWLSTVPLYSAAALTGVNNVVLPGVSDYVIDLSASAGPFTGFVAQRDAQRITFVNTSGGAITFTALSGSSAAANQIQASANEVLANNDSFSIKYSSGFGKWLVA